ncbi:hypothetical protein M0R45_018319 [Rubus argutus]|uniref:Uncharacterized protein n=1 Tax=Rubus argutus TaxID=59490 RepID=A0AAW1X3T6_RUBAR
MRACKARVAYLGVHFKNTSYTMETAFAIRKFPLAKAKRYLEDVMVHKQAIPFHCTNGHVKCAFFILDLLNNAESNDEIKAYMSSPCHIELILSEKAEPETQFKKSSLGMILIQNFRQVKMLIASTLGYDPDVDDMEKVETLKGNAATTKDRPPKKLKCLCGVVLGQLFTT